MPKKLADCISLPIKGEWFLNLNEGINRKNIIKKNPEKDLVRNEILSGLIQVDSSLYLTDFDYELDNRGISCNARIRTKTVKINSA